MAFQRFNSGNSLCSLGGKLGIQVDKTVRQYHHMPVISKDGDPPTSIAQLQMVPEECLKSEYSHETAKWLHQIAHSLDQSSVKPLDRPKSILSMKSFSTSYNEESVFKW